MAQGRWFFRVIELGDGRWACRRGPEHFDSHDHLVEALAHIRTIATPYAPAELFVHSLDGDVRSGGVID